MAIFIIIKDFNLKSISDKTLGDRQNMSTKNVRLECKS